MPKGEWNLSALERTIPKRFKRRAYWMSYLKRFAECSTYWYIPKARSLGKESIDTAKRILQIIFDEYLDSEWNRETQLRLHNELVEKNILKPTADQASANVSDITALERIYKRWFEILGLAYIEMNHWTITDVGLDLLSQKKPEKLIVNQLYRFQFPDGLRGEEAQWKRITPLPFVIELLRRNDHLDRNEWILFVNLAQSNEDIGQISELMKEWRELTDVDRDKMLRIVTKIPIALEQNKDIFGSNIKYDISGTRYNRIKLNSSYQMSFFGFPDYLVVTRGRMQINEKVKAYKYPDFENITPIAFKDDYDWISYFGDPKRKPDWVEEIKYRMSSSKSEKEAKELLEKAGEQIKHKAAVEDREEIERTYFEKFIEDFYKDHLSLIESGLQLHQESDAENNLITGQQYSTAIGRMDLLCRSKSGAFVVIEVKKDEADDAAVGQVLRYMGWLYKHKSKNVRGVLLAGGFTDKTKYARIAVILNKEANYLSLMRYKIKPEVVI